MFDHAASLKPTQFRALAHARAASRRAQARLATLWLPMLAALPVLSAAGCERVIGIDKYHISSTPADSAAVGCKSHTECGASATDTPFQANFCVRATGRCVSLKSEECQDVAGPVQDDEAVVLGALVTLGSASATGLNRARVRSMELAIEELNAVGGLPGRAPQARSRPLVLVTCDEQRDAMRAAQHLAEDLHVAAIVGPTTSQAGLDIPRQVTIPAEVLTISATALAGGIAELRDDDLVWQMVPNDPQRSPLLVQQLQTMELALHSRLQRDLKLGAIFQEGALGDEARSSLAQLTWNGEPVADAATLGATVKLSTFDATNVSQDELIATYTKFAPDVLLVIGGTRIVSSVLTPLEAALRAAGVATEYLLTDSAKGPDLLALVQRNPELRHRLRGTGVRPSPAATPVYQSFVLGYQSRYPGDTSATEAGVGPSYDAVYAIAFALAATSGDTSRDVAHGLRRLSGGKTIVPIGPTRILSAFAELQSMQAISALGTFSALKWDDRGAISAGTMEVWCVDIGNGTPSYVSSGLTADIPWLGTSGANQVCGIDLPNAVVAGQPPAAPAGQSSLDAGIPETATPAMEAMTPDANSGTPAKGNLPTDSGMAQPDSSSAPTQTPPNQTIACGDTKCQRSEQEYCCIEGSLTVSSGRSVSFSCEQAARSCTATLRCTSDKECSPGELCCIDEQSVSQCRAATSCGSALHLACRGAADCPSGQLCCAQGDDPFELRASKCQKQCPSDMAPRQLCSSQMQCPPGHSCLQSWALPSTGLCFRNGPPSPP